MIKVSKSFVCRGYTGEPASMNRTSMNIGDGARLELLDFFMFCYQGDMLSADGDDDAALEAIICKA